jgi:predicted nucleic acid-binding protein
MILLDTNVLSELMRAKPEPTVMAFVNGIPTTALFTSAVTQAEILYGIALLPAGKRRDSLLDAARVTLNDHFRGRVLPFDGSAAETFASIAAIAKSRDATLVTRNSADFDGCGIPVVNPWSGRP